MTTPPPFRADHVGSLLRPPELREARLQAKSGQLSLGAFKTIEQRCIREVIARQEAIGLQGITDGEFSRDWWHLDFLAGIEGVELRTSTTLRFEGVDDIPPTPAVSGKLRALKPDMIDAFTFLESATSGTAKFTIPSPSMLHMRGGRNAISREAYPDIDAFWSDAASAYRAAIGQFAAAGCTYLQLDDVSFSYLCDEKFRASARNNGDDPAALPRIYAAAINAALRNRPAGMAVTMHTCRGNFRSTWVAASPYDNAVMEAMFSTDVDAFFMEFDSDRAGGFESLRLLPRGKKVVLGLVTTKLGKLEAKDELKRRIDAAAKIVPLEDLCLSPQCGFASTHHGNTLSYDEQWRKLERVVEVAREVWG